MGRVTIFALQVCPHCKRTKAALTARGIPYTEISLSDYPHKRSDMLALADRLTVPQVFFNDEHIGGADDTLMVLEQWDKEAKYPTALERYEKEIASVENAPSDVRLEVPTTPPVQATPEPPRSEDDLILLPNGEKKSVLEVTQLLVKGMPRSDKGYHLKVYMNVFTGVEGVDTLLDMFKLQSREEAVAFGQLLQERKLLNHVTYDHKFQDKDFFYRLQAFQEPKVLNTYRVWTDRVDPDSMALLARLKKLMGNIESECTNDEGYLDYVAAKKHPKYDILEEAVCELQGVNFKDMVEDEKLAFGINLYNLMIKHAFMKVGIPSGALMRSAFFTSVKYVIGGDFLSFSDLEDGVLRGNKMPPGQFQVPFPSAIDNRLELVFKSVDPRIHFALNCGAKSCPPVKTFTSQAIKEELRIVAQAFCEQDDNVGVDEENRCLSLSKIMSWYRIDFAPSISKLPEIIVTFLRGEKKEKLQRMVDSGKAINVTFNEYDWSTNASKCEQFKESKLELKKIGLAF